MSEEGEIEKLREEIEGLEDELEGAIEKLREEIEGLEDELEGANNQIKDLEEEIDDLRRMVDDLKDEALDDKNKTESDHIKMLEKFMLDNGFILGSGQTMESLLWELGRQIHMLKKRGESLCLMR